MNQCVEEKLTFIKFWRMLLASPTSFFRQYLAPEAPRPYWGLMVGLFLSTVLVERQINFRFSDDFQQINSSDTYYVYQLGYSLRVLLSGLLVYFLGAWGMKLQIAICGGKVSVGQARSIMIYATAVSNASTLLLGAYIYLLLHGWFISTLWQMFAGGALIVILCLISCIYTLHISYRGFMVAPGTKRGRALFMHLIFFFILLFSALANIGPNA